VEEEKKICAKAAREGSSTGKAPTLLRQTPISLARLIVKFVVDTPTTPRVEFSSARFLVSIQSHSLIAATTNEG